MRRFRRVSLLVALAIAGAGCGLVYDLSKLGPDDGDGGADAAEAGAAIDAGPRTCPSDRGSPMVDLGAFCIDAKEATNAHYAAFLEDVTKTGIQPALPPTCSFKRSLSQGSTVAADGRLPVRDVDWCDALSYCRWAHKRLCGKIGGGSLRRSQATSPALSEWGFACTRNDEARALPYGTSFEPGRCNVPGDASAPLPASSTCEGGFAGIFDLVGNVAEWVDACEAANGPDDECEVLGGSFLSSGGEATCTSIEPAARKSQRTDHGIRCCAR